MLRPSVSRAILGGFVATIAITALMYGGPMMGMPKMDIAEMLGTIVGGWWMGMAVHFINGTLIFPLIYVFALYNILPGAPWLKGTTWGLTLWFLAQAVVTPAMGMGFFSSGAPAPLMAILGSFIGHFVYGALLGAITGSALSRAAIEEQPESFRRVA